MGLLATGTNSCVCYRPPRRGGKAPLLLQAKQIRHFSMRLPITSGFVGWGMGRATIKQNKKGPLE